MFQCLCSKNMVPQDPNRLCLAEKYSKLKLVLHAILSRMSDIGWMFKNAVPVYYFKIKTLLELQNFHCKTDWAAIDFPVHHCHLPPGSAAMHSTLWGYDNINKLTFCTPWRNDTYMRTHRKYPLNHLTLPHPSGNINFIYYY